MKSYRIYKQIQISENSPYVTEIRKFTNRQQSRELRPVHKFLIFKNKRVVAGLNYFSAAIITAFGITQ